MLLPIASGVAAQEVRTINADVYADNWFALYEGETLVKEDSVAYDTERSFNSDSFSFEATLPLQLNLIIKDYKKNDSGLEYIGTNRQQMGDGGFAAQFFDAESNTLLAVSNSNWRCMAAHRAPLNKSCVTSSNPLRDCEAEITPEPDGWMRPEFDDSAWPSAIEHSAEAVRPIRGYHDVEWHDDVKLIWTQDLESDNTLLCRTSISAP
jgi:hypothetical protein